MTKATINSSTPSLTGIFNINNIIKNTFLTVGFLTSIVDGGEFYDEIKSDIELDELRRQNYIKDVVHDMFVYGESVDLKGLEKSAKWYVKNRGQAHFKDFAPKVKVKDIMEYISNLDENEVAALQERRQAHKEAKRLELG